MKGLTAGGAVLLRGAEQRRRVLVVHRPAYDDWTLPKGKPRADEPLPATAVREVREETGLSIVLRAPLGTTSYAVEGVPKTVNWWRGVEVRDAGTGAVAVTDEREVDRLVWLSTEDAQRRLSYPDEVAVLQRACATPETIPFLVVRHAKAMRRRSWAGRDSDRRLTERGRRQSAALVTSVLAAFGVQLVASSSSTRCVDTFRPFAEAAERPLQRYFELSEEGAAAEPQRVALTMQLLRRQCLELGMPLAACGHRPVLPGMLAAVGLDPAPMQVAEIRAAHLNPEGGTVTGERITPAF